MDCKEFTEKYYVDRKRTDCIKWDRADVKDNLPMFIADMDFKTDEHIIEELKKRTDHGAFGYSFLPKDYLTEYNKWYKRRQKVDYKKEYVRFASGAVGALYQIIYSLTKEKDPILITTPVYHPFSAAIKATKRTLVVSPLTRKDGLFTFNYKDLEKKFKEKKVKVMVLCSPHNPLGRVWTKEELEQLFKLTHKYHVLVVSDEVHSDLIMPGYKFTPSYAFKQYQNEIITINALSKSLSLAIFSHCHLVIPNKKYRDKIDAYQAANHFSVNVFNAYPTYFGFKYGEEWLASVIKVIDENFKYFNERLSKYVDILPLEGTYLIFVDFKKYAKNGAKFLKEKCHIIPNTGEEFASTYASWARINLATSKENIIKACDNIEKALLATKK